MKYICTITDKSYLRYTLRFLLSVRGVGWRGPIIVFTPDNDIYCNETVIKLTRTLYSPRYLDCRWMVFEINNHFKKSDKVLFFDSDCVLTDKFPINKIFKHDFVLTKKKRSEPDAYTESFEQINAIMGVETNEEYVASPLLWKKCKENDRLFNILRLGSFCSFHHGGGINVTLTSTLKMYNKKIDYCIPYDKILYTSDKDRAKKKEDAWLIHYGGNLGKQMWENEYA